MEGWIKISRELPKHWIWCDAERLKWWLDLLLRASWEDTEMMHDGNKFTLKRGQLIAPVSLLVKRWGRSAPTIIKFLKLLESEGMIYRQTLYRQTSILTICNYASYQDCVDTQVDTLVYPQVNTQVDTLVYSNKEIKEILLKKDISKDISKEKPSRFTPPSLSDIQAYVTEKNLSVDPEQFMDYYQARDWILSNGKKMKDFRAGLRYWNRNQRSYKRPMLSDISERDNNYEDLRKSIPDPLADIEEA